VVLGLLAPATRVARVEATLHPWVAYLIMPLFAFANAGVQLQGLGNGPASSASIAWGVLLGLVLGKPIGIVLATTTLVRLGWCSLPVGISWRHIAVLGCLGGIGFTMSIFIADLAFPNAMHLAMAKGAVLAASAAAAIGGLILGRVLLPLPGVADETADCARRRR
jgi:NhaA family Na+:H+ antiporter